MLVMRSSVIHSRSTGIHRLNSVQLPRRITCILVSPSPVNSLSREEAVLHLK